MSAMSEAISIAEQFNWAPEIPDAVEQMRRGVIPKGFGRLVGQAIALFLERPIIGWTFISPNRPNEFFEEKNLRAHAKQLARLRLLIARINIEKRKGNHVHSKNQLGSNPA